MPTAIPRHAALLAASAALIVLPLPARAATGPFEYCAGRDCRTLSDPAAGACHTLEITATSVTNGTDTFAILYSGRHCSSETDEGEPVGPGEQREVPPSNSVIFYS